MKTNVGTSSCKSFFSNEFEAHNTIPFYIGFVKDESTYEKNRGMKNSVIKSLYIKQLPPHKNYTPIG